MGWVGRLLCIAVVLAACALAAEVNVTNLGKAISIPASQYWDGDDGRWSTFRIEIGTPPQQIRVLPAADQSSTWVILPEACTGDSSCSDNRGTTYERNSSKTWQEFGSYALNTFLEGEVGLNGDGLYGYDTLALGWTGDGLPSLQHQILAGILTEDFYLGSLGLNPRPINFTNYNDPIPSLLENLKTNSSTPIPSNSWSYTAGGYNLSPKVFGNLVLGGYDTTRFKANNVTFPFGADISLDFQVAIQSVTSNTTNTALLSTGIISYVDTLVPEIWLPTDACKKFEQTFGLVWDSKTELYLLNDSLHDSLLAANPVISFKVGPQTSGESVTIDMPYWNWYQSATSAFLGNNSGLYFPLKRAANDSQYVLGRTFLQSAHISADYERNVFNLSQALYPSTSTAGNIVAILPILDEGSPTGGNGNGNGNGNGKSSKSSGLGSGAIAGIAVGIVAVVVLLAAVAYIFYRRKKKSKKEEYELEDTNSQNRTGELPGEEVKHELRGDGTRHEVGGDEQHKIELHAEGESQKPAEIGVAREIYEMPADQPKYAEMEGEGHHEDNKPPFITGHGTGGTSRRGTEGSSPTSYIQDDDMLPLTPPVDTEHRRG